MAIEQPLQFIRGGQPVSLRQVPADRTLLQVLREDLGCTSVKEGCAQGDCGACTVVIGSPDPQDGQRLQLQAVNACIRLAHSVHGLAVWTASDLPAIVTSATPAEAPAPPSGQTLHPVQTALVAHHGSQCGFCTPGFVMSLFALYENEVLAGHAVSRDHAAHALSGNLCRCTGYRPILDAAQSLPDCARHALDRATVLQQLKQIPPAHPDTLDPRGYVFPRDLRELLSLREQLPDATLVAGATDLGLWITKQHRRLETLIDLTRVPELRTLTHTPSAQDDGTLHIGAAVTLTEAFGALAHWFPALEPFFLRFAGLPVRNAGTLGGNVVNGSPIGDSMPLLLALGAHIVLASTRGTRTLALEDFYLGYRQTALAADEVLTAITVPLGTAAQRARVRAYKISKRQDDDISAVCLALQLEVQDGRVRDVRLGAGGVAAIPVRALKTEAALRHQPWNAATVQAAMQVLCDEFTPLSDMRASSAYRRAVLARLLWRYWLEDQGTADLDIRQAQPLAWTEGPP